MDDVTRAQTLLFIDITMCAMFTLVLLLFLLFVAEQKNSFLVHTIHRHHAARNAHPQSSDSENAFIVVHNGIVSNYGALKEALVKEGYEFKSDTDTEVIAVFLKFTHDKNANLSFREVVAAVTARLEGAFALIIKSRRFPVCCYFSKNILKNSHET